MLINKTSLKNFQRNDFIIFMKYMNKHIGGMGVLVAIILASLAYTSLYTEVEGYDENRRRQLLQNIKEKYRNWSKGKTKGQILTDIDTMLGDEKTILFIKVINADGTSSPLNNVTKQKMSNHYRSKLEKDLNNGIIPDEVKNLLKLMIADPKLYRASIAGTADTNSKFIVECLKLAMVSMVLIDLTTFGVKLNTIVDSIIDQSLKKEVIERINLVMPYKTAWGWRPIDEIVLMEKQMALEYAKCKQKIVVKPPPPPAGGAVGAVGIPPTAGAVGIQAIQAPIYTNTNTYNTYNTNNANTNTPLTYSPELPPSIPSEPESAPEADAEAEPEAESGPEINYLNILLVLVFVIMIIIIIFLLMNPKFMKRS